MLCNSLCPVHLDRGGSKKWGRKERKDDERVDDAGGEGAAMLPSDLRDETLQLEVQNPRPGGGSRTGERVRCCFERSSGKPGGRNVTLFWGKGEVPETGRKTSPSL